MIVQVLVISSIKNLPPICQSRFKISPKACLEAFKLGNESAKEIVVRCSGPQFSNIVMDQCQNPDSKLHVQTSLKESCKVDYSDADVSQTKLESKLS